MAQKLKEVKIFGMGDLAFGCYKKHGKGILWNQPANPPRYILDSCKWLKNAEKKLIKKYNPEIEAIILEFYEPQMSASRIELQSNLVKMKAPISREVRTGKIKICNQLSIHTKLNSIDELANLIEVLDENNTTKKIPDFLLQ